MSCLNIKTSDFLPGILYRNIPSTDRKSRIRSWTLNSSLVPSDLNWVPLIVRRSFHLEKNVSRLITFYTPSSMQDAWHIWASYWALLTKESVAQWYCIKTQSYLRQGKIFVSPRWYLFFIVSLSLIIWNPLQSQGFCKLFSSVEKCSKLDT